MGSGVAGLFVTGPGFGRGGGQGASPPPGSDEPPATGPSACRLLPAPPWNPRVGTDFVCNFMLGELRMGRECSFADRATGLERRASQRKGIDAPERGDGSYALTPRVGAQQRFPRPAP
ncbi:hypothetical protein GCM10010234_81360 [Streptomyces hawaiiensis]